MILILSDDAKQQIGKRLYEILLKKQVKAKYISLAGLRIETCHNCGGCNKVEYGKCVIPDDMQDVLYEMAASDKYIWVCPVTFGSYSPQAKKALDRTCVLGDIHYHMAGREMVKGTKIKGSEFWAIGVKDHCSEEEQALFLNLTAENIKLMNVEGKGYVIAEQAADEKIREIAEEIING